MENFQVTQGIKQKYVGELHIFCIITEAKQAMEEAHLGVCGARQSGSKLMIRSKGWDIIDLPWCKTT